MPPSLDQARAALAAQPFSRLLGAQLNRFGPDGVELEVPVRPEHRQQHGFAHGGLLGYAADNALTFAAGAVAGPEVLTAGYTINVLAPVLGDLWVPKTSFVGLTWASPRQRTSAMIASHGIATALPHLLPAHHPGSDCSPAARRPRTPRSSYYDMRSPCCAGRLPGHAPPGQIARCSRR
jgi:hypothetical protein